MRFQVDPYLAPIKRFDFIEYVFVCAIRGEEAMYYEDIEEGFNISPLSSSGEILVPGSDQDELKYALNRWRPKCEE